MKTAEELRAIANPGPLTSTRIIEEFLDVLHAVLVDLALHGKMNYNFDLKVQLSKLFPYVEFEGSVYIIVKDLIKSKLQESGFNVLFEENIMYLNWS